MTVDKENPGSIGVAALSVGAGAQRAFSASSRGRERK
jgi:hypothetical protein